MKNERKGMSFLDKKMQDSQVKTQKLEACRALLTAMLYYALPDRKPTTDHIKEVVDEFTSKVYTTLLVFDDNHNRYTVMRKYCDKLPFTPEVRKTFFEQIQQFQRAVNAFGDKLVEETGTIGNEAATANVLEKIYPAKFRVSVLKTSMANMGMMSWQ